MLLHLRRSLGVAEAEALHGLPHARGPGGYDGFPATKHRLAQAGADAAARRRGRWPGRVEAVPTEGLVRTLAVGVVGAWSQEAGAPQLREGPALVAVVGADVIALKLRAQLRVWPRVFVQGLCGLGELMLCT